MVPVISFTSRILTEFSPSHMGHLTYSLVDKSLGIHLTGTLKTAVMKRLSIQLEGMSQILQ